MKAFSLLEIIISVIIGAVAIVALFELAFGNITTAELIRHRLIAAHLAQEGIEIISNIRTQNWLTTCAGGGECDTSTWRNGLAGGTYIAQYNSLSLTFDALNPPLAIDDNSFYCYSSGCIGTAKDSPYHRQITISTINDHQMKVVATVSWIFNGNSYSVSAEDRLYNYL